MVLDEKAGLVIPEDRPSFSLFRMAWWKLLPCLEISRDLLHYGLFADLCIGGGNIFVVLVPAGLVLDGTDRHHFGTDPRGLAAFHLVLFDNFDFCRVRGNGSGNFYSGDPL